MKKILSTRGMGKTTELFNFALDYAKNNPDTSVFFISYNTKEAIEQYDSLPENLFPLRYFSYLDRELKGRNMECRKNAVYIIDEVQPLLEHMKIIAYSDTIGE